MKKKKSKTHNYSRHRSILSDTLAYETPLTFSNRYFYRFLRNNNIDLITSNDKNSHQTIIFNGKGDAILETVIRVLFQVENSLALKEIKFTNYSNCLHTINNLLAFNSLTSFLLTLNGLLELRITNRRSFLKLLSSIDGLKGEAEYISKSQKRIYKGDDLKFSVEKVISLILQRYCDVTIDLKKLTIKCSANHPLLPNFLGYEIIKENILKLNEKKLRRTSFNYKISHKDNDYRELSIPHPKTQTEIINFYEEYKELIIYYCGVSPYSIRKPDSIANFIFFNDRFHLEHKGDKYDNVEESGKEYESLKTFFTYRKYPNIHQFYEDYRYHRAEKKYNSMFKFDISKCFDSVYTHSVAWAIYGKTVVKERLKGADITFPGKFDAFMQNGNFGETNGILIGPEFSRIFAEIILQSIDKEIECYLREEKSLIFKRDYEIYRYVDDYFIFYNDDETRDEILSKYKVVMKTYKMSLSEVKNKEYGRPLITELTIAKNKIISLIDSEICYIIKEKENSEFSDLNFRCNAKNLITKFKIIISESGVAYKDIMNFTLAILNKRIDDVIEKFDKYYGHLVRFEFKNEGKPESFSVDDVTRKFKHENTFTNFLIELLDFTFFIYTVDPRVNFTIKLCRILSRMITLYTEKIKFFTGTFNDPISRTGPIYTSIRTKYSLENKDRMFKKISDEIRLVLEKNKVKKYAQIESLYLLIAVQQLGRDYSLSPELLIKYFGLKRSNNNILEFDFIPNYFVITVLLFYIRDAKAYVEITDLIKSCIINKIENIDGEKGLDTEVVLLLFDVLVCPYLDSKFKRKALNAFGVTNQQQQDHLISFKKKQKYWFTKWDNFNFLDEIEAKIAHEPY